MTKYTVEVSVTEEQSVSILRAAGTRTPGEYLRDILQHEIRRGASIHRTERMIDFDSTPAAQFLRARKFNKAYLHIRWLYALRVIPGSIQNVIDLATGVTSARGIGPVKRKALVSELEKQGY